MLISFCAVLALAACGSENQGAEISPDTNLETNGIVGAEKISKTDLGFKSTVTLLSADDDSGFCTGTLIDSRIVLTAAHCMEDTDPTSVKIRFFDGSIIDVGAKEVHPDFSVEVKKGIFSQTAVFTADVALLGLNEDAPKSAVRAKLPQSPLKVGQYKVRAFGIGRTDVKKQDSGVMRMVNITGAVKKEEPTKLIFDQKNKKGVCYGDSGGPFFMYDKKGQPSVVAITNGVQQNGAILGQQIGDLCAAKTQGTQTGSYAAWITTKKKSVLKALAANEPHCFDRTAEHKEFYKKLSESFSDDFKNGIEVLNYKSVGSGSSALRGWLVDFKYVSSAGKNSGGQIWMTPECDFIQMSSF